MISEFSNVDSPFFGFRYATQSEIIQLWAEAGLREGGSNDPTAVDNYLQLFGTNFGNAQYSVYGQTEFLFDFPDFPSVPLTFHVVGSEGDFAHDPYAFHFDDNGDFGFSGHAIVRTAEVQVVPEPSTYMLFASMLTATVILTRTHRKIKGRTGTVCS